MKKITIIPFLFLIITACKNGSLEEEMVLETISLSNSQVNEFTWPGNKVGKLTTNLEANEDFFINSNNPVPFTIKEDSLMLKEALDYEEKSSYNLKITAIHGEDSLTEEKTITVNDQVFMKPPEQKFRVDSIIIAGDYKYFFNYKNGLPISVDQKYKDTSNPGLFKFSFDIDNRLTMVEFGKEKYEYFYELDSLRKSRLTTKVNEKDNFTLEINYKNGKPIKGIYYENGNKTEKEEIYTYENENLIKIKKTFPDGAKQIQEINYTNTKFPENLDYLRKTYLKRFTSNPYQLFSNSKDLVKSTKNVELEYNITNGKIENIKRFYNEVESVLKFYY